MLFNVYDESHIPDTRTCVQTCVERFPQLNWCHLYVQDAEDGMDGDQPEEESAPETRIEVEIPKVSTDLGSDLYFVKLPNFLSVEPRCVDVFKALKSWLLHPRIGSLSVFSTGPSTLSTTRTSLRTRRCWMRKGGRVWSWRWRTRSGGALVETKREMKSKRATRG